MPGQCYFQTAWLDKPEFRDWVGRVAEEKTSAYCRVCKKSISVRRLGVSALTTHAKGSKHMKAMRSVSSALGNIDTLVQGDRDKNTTAVTTTSLQTSGGAVQSKILTGGTETLNAEILWMLKQANVSSKKRKILSDCSSSGEEEPSQILAPIEDTDLDESFNLRPWQDSKSQTLPHPEKTPARISSTNGADVKVERDQEHDVEAATFWGHCNTAGCTDAIFCDFLNHMKDVSLRIQNEQASQQDFVVAFKVMMASGKMTEMLRKQEKGKKKATAERLPVPKPKRSRAPSTDEAIEEHRQEETRSRSRSRSPSPPHEEASAPPTATPARKKKKALFLSDEQEVELADWLKENPMLYTKSMKEYKNTAKKIDLWNSKAADLDLEDGAMLKTWYESVRTRVGKLSDKKSGSATKDKTDRDTFMMQNFGFLASHIARVKGRTAFSLKPRLDMAPPTVSSDSEQEMEQDTQEKPEETGDQCPVPEPTTSKGKSCTVRGRRIPSKSSSQNRTSTPVPALDDTAEIANLISSLQDQQQRSDAIQGQITGLLSREQRSATAAWGTWIGTMAANLDPTLLPRFYRASLDMMLSFTEESRQLQIQQPQQQQPQQQQQHDQRTFTTLLTPVQQQQQQQYQQQQQTFVGGGRATPSWDTMGPTAGQNVPQSVRPASTPPSLNYSFQLPSIPDFSNLNTTTPSPVGQQPDGTFN